MWMLIADIHIEGQWSSAGEHTLQWLLAEHRRHRPEHVFILGDAVHCRKGSIPAVQRLKTWINDLIDGGFPCQVHLIVGNHDMPNLHDRSVSTVAIVGQPTIGIHVYSEVARKIISDVPVLFIPWHEDGSQLPPIITRHAQMSDAASTIVLGHLGLKGARLSGHSHGSHGSVMHDENAHLAPGDFDHFNHTFLGHYHDPKTYGKATYVGSPMQHNFGDAHITDRGYVLYNPRTAKWDLHTNPHAVQFVDISSQDALAGSFNTSLDGKSVRLILGDNVGLHEEEKARRMLGNIPIAGLKVLRRTSQALNPSAANVHEQPVQDPHAFLINMIDKFVAEQRPAWVSAASYMKDLCAPFVSMSNQSIFRADITEIVVENFLGIHGTKHFNFDALPRGVYMVQGPNGAGKSQLIDAIAWCLFAKTFRGAGQTEIKNNKEKDKRNCCVTVRFENGTIVRRTLKPSLVVTCQDGRVLENGSGVKDTQDALEHELNSNWESFRRTVLLDSADFLTLFTKQDGQRNAVLEALLGMGILDQLFSKVDDDHKSTVEKQKVISCERDALEQHHKSATHEQKVLRNERNNTDRLLVELEQTRVSLETEMTKQNEATRVYTVDMLSLQADVARVSSIIADLQPSILEATARHARLSAESTAHRDRHSDTQLTLDINITKKTKLIDRMDAISQDMDCLLKGQHSLDSASALVKLILTQITEHQMETAQTLEDMTTHKESQLMDRMRTLEQNSRVQHFFKSAVKRGQWGQAPMDQRNGCVLSEQVRMSIKNIIRKATEHAESSKIQSVIDGIEVDVVQPLRKMVICDSDLQTVTDEDDERDEDEEDDEHDEDDEDEEEIEHIIQDTRDRYKTVRATELKLLMHKKDTAISEETRVSSVITNCQRLKDEHSQIRLQLPILDEQITLSQASIVAYSDSDLQSELNHAECDVKRIQESIEAFALSLTGLETKLDEVKCQLKAAAETNLHAVEERGHLIGRISQLQDRNIASKDTVQELEAMINSLDSQMSDVDTQGENLALVAGMQAFWKDALTNVNDNLVTTRKVSHRGLFRKMCRGEHLRFLQDRIEENMAILHGDNRNLHLACVLSEAFQVQQAGSSAKWNQRSSGERKKTILAILFAILDSMMTHGLFKPSFLTLDEVHDNLDAEGRRSVYRLLTAFRTRHPNHRIFVISHNESEMGNADGTITVTPSILGDKRLYAAKTAAGVPIDNFYRWGQAPTAPI